MKFIFSPLAAGFAAIACSAALEAQTFTPPPVAGGIVDIEVESPAGNSIVVYEYQPARPATLLVESLSHSIQQKVTVSETPGTPGSTEAEFIFDPGYKNQYPRLIKPLKGGWIYYGTGLQYSRVSLTTNWDGDGRASFILEADHLGATETSSIAGDGFGPFFAQQYDHNVWSSLVSGYNRTSQSGYISTFHWLPLHYYLPGAPNYWIESEAGGPELVYNDRRFDDLGGGVGSFYALGKLTRTGAPGIPPSRHLAIEPLEEPSAKAALSSADWTFAGVFEPGTSAAASYEFSASQASATKTRYKIKIQPGVARKVTWLERFTPTSTGVPTYKLKAEEVSAAAEETAVNTLDPFADPATPGRYEVVAESAADFTAELAVDGNHDGQIFPTYAPLTGTAVSLSDATTSANPFIFLLNLNDDNADGLSDALDAEVNGASDLAGFVPVFLDIKRLLELFPSEATYILSHEESAFNFMYTNLTRQEAAAFLSDTRPEYGKFFNKTPEVADVEPVTAVGVALTEEFLNRIKYSNKGVILLEARTPTIKPLVLTVVTPTGTATLQLHLRPVGAELAVDSNRDGQIRLSSEGSSDRTTATASLTFWLNDDIDRVHSFEDSAADTMATVTETEEDDIGPAEAQSSLMSPDCWTNNKADSKRDLEDFARLQLYIGGLGDSFKNGQLFLGLKWTDVTGDPAIRIYKQHDTTGSLDYLTDETEAAAQLAEYAIRDARYQSESASTSLHAMIHGTETLILPASLFANLSDTSPKTHLLFEGVKAGKGQLKLVILKQENGNYTEIGDGPGVWMDLKKIGDMYEHWSVGNASGGEPAAVAGRVAAEGGTTAFSYTATSPEEQKYILFVHGWNMEKWEKERFAETAYKRLWGQGYKGRFGLFTWPTTNNFAGGAIQGLMDGTNFDRGEYSAWRSGAPLRQLMQTLYSAYGGKLYVFSHSMGGVVASEALRLQSDAGGGHIASVYVASQAALSVHCYDGTLSEAAGSPDAVQWTYNHPSLPNGTQNYGPQTPNIYRNWTAYVLGGSATSSSAVGALVNFYNVNDWALAAPAWHFNQITKPDYPDPSNLFTYDYNEAPEVFNDVFRKTPSTGGPIALHLGTRTAPEDRYEIMSFAAESRVRSFGAAPLLSQGVSGLVDLRQLEGWDTDGGANKAHKWHSAQFRSTIVRQRAYWRTLLGQNGFNILLTPILP